MASGSPSSKNPLSPDQLEHLRRAVTAMVHKKLLYLTSRRADADDFVQVGVIAALEAYERWQPGRGASWLSFVMFRAHGAIIDEYRRLSPGTRGEQAAGTSPEVDSLDAERSLGDGAASLLEQLPGDLDVDLSESDLSHDDVLERAMARLTPYEQTVLDLYYFEGMRLHEVGALMGVTESRVSQLHSCALRKLRRDSTVIEMVAA